MIGRATGEENEPFLSGCRARTRGRLVSWAIGWTGLAGALATGSGYEADRPACAGSSNTEPRVRALYCALTTRNVKVVVVFYHCPDTFLNASLSRW